MTTPMLFCTKIIPFLYRILFKYRNKNDSFYTWRKTRYLSVTQNSKKRLSNLFWKILRKWFSLWRNGVFLLFSTWGQGNKGKLYLIFLFLRNSFSYICVSHYLLLLHIEQMKSEKDFIKEKVSSILLKL